MRSGTAQRPQGYHGELSMANIRFGQRMGIGAAAFLLGGGIILAGAGQPEGQEDPNSVGAHMDAAGKAFRKLQKQIADPAQNASSLELVQTIEENLVAAKRFVPDEWTDEWKDKPDAERAGAFHKDLATEIGLILEIEKSLIDGNNKAAADGFEKAKAGQKAGHKKFKKEEEQGLGGKR